MPQQPEGRTSSLPPQNRRRTAALDSESEQQVQEAIEHLCRNRTTIVIAHRLHTIMHADAILVVEGGEIVERGRHDDLLRRGADQRNRIS